MKSIGSYIAEHQGSVGSKHIFISSSARDRELLDELYGSAESVVKPPIFISSAKRDQKLLKQLYGSKSKKIDEDEGEWKEPLSIDPNKWKRTPEQEVFHKKLSDFHNEHVAPHITPKEKEHLEHYTSSFSGPINKHLLGISSGIRANGLSHLVYVNGETHEDSIRHIDSAISKSKLPQHIKTYSGLGFDPRQYGMKEVGDKLHLKAFTSSSLEHGISHGFAKSNNTPSGDLESHFMKFHLKPGQHALYVSSEKKKDELGNVTHRPLSGTVAERELILPRDTHVKLIKHEVFNHGKIGGHFDNRDNVHHLWHVEVEPHHESQG